MGPLLGGSASPIGWSVQYLQAPVADVLGGIRRIRQGGSIDILDPCPFPEALSRLWPLEAPWTRELVVPCGGWTAYLNNFVSGGDPTAIGPAIARSQGVRCVVAQHAPGHGPGHAATQLWVLGPAGEPPLLYERTISSTAVDGRWQWTQSGPPLSFEDVSRYAARRIRDRFDRALLIRYLEALGVPADDDSAYGNGVIVQQRVTWPRRTVSQQDARVELGL